MGERRAVYSVLVGKPRLRWEENKKDGSSGSGL